MARINVNRGLFRTWVALTALWLVFVGVSAWQGWLIERAKPDDWGGIPIGEAAAARDLPDAPWVMRDLERWDTIRRGTMMAIIPPIAVAGLGVLMLWAARGFRP